MLRNSRAFFYTGTYPAPYTLGFVEAWITGIPAVAIGHKLRDYHFRGAPGLWEIPELLTDWITGIYSDETFVLHAACNSLLRDVEEAKEIGAAGRAAAIPLFGKQAAIRDWSAVLL